MTQRAGARSPEELEALFEDTLIMGDREALLELFETHAVLAGRDARLTHGREDIAGLVLTALDGDRSYVADLRQVIQANDIALIVSEWGINVARRARDGAWRYLIVSQATGDKQRRTQ